MKSLKKSLVTLLACTMAIAPCMVGNMPVSAAEGDTTTYSITVNKGDTAAHKYEAYQVFKGDLTEDGILSNIVWGSGVLEEGETSPTDLLSALASFNTAFNASMTAKDVAGVLETQVILGTEDDEVKSAKESFMRGFADVVGSYLRGTNTTADVDTGKIDGLAAGYYLVKDQENTLGGEHAAYTQFILKLTDNASVTAKSVLPTLDKVINEGAGVKANTASIGDDVEFKLTSKVPDMTGYDKYFFVVNDTLSSGFTFDINSVAIKIGEYTLTAPVYDDPETEGVNEATDGAYYVVDDGNGNIKIVIRNFISYQARKNQTIEITYSAELNDGASVSTTGADANTNVANLVYSNNPNYEYRGDTSNPDEPGKQPNDPTTPEDESELPEPTGNTPPITTVTYTTQLEITKVDGDNTATKLQGAVFKLEKLDGEDNYGQVGAEITTDEDGLATFNRLEVGKYQITEITAPDGGYNLLENPIQFEITTQNISTGSITWNATDAEDDITFADGMFKIQIGNYKGSSLPTTGGMGTTLIYVLGGMLVLCSIVLIITRKRMEYRQF